MTSTKNVTVDRAAPAGRIAHRQRLLGLPATGVVGTLAAMAATTLAAALAGALGVDFEIPDGGQAMPLPGFAVMTGLFSLIGVVLAVALLRWSARPVAAAVMIPTLARGLLRRTGGPLR